MVSNSCSPEELRTLLAFMEQSENREIVEQWIFDHYANAELVSAGPELAARLQQRLDNILTPKRRVIHWWAYAAAAAILLLVAGAYLWQQKTTVKHQPIALQQDVKPGVNKAILTLGNGQQVVLDSAGHQLIQQGGANISQQGGQLSYNNTSRHEPVINTLSTPKGGQFQIVLPDGSRVWLNAASSLQYPTAFTGKERVVTLSGEGYFEIAKNERQPFFVKVQQTTVAVLGTSFNINAYNDEPGIATTLLEGAVQVEGGLERHQLQPGQQLNSDHNGGHISIAAADAEAAIAWKNGLFMFDDTDLATVLRQLSRWYNVNVVYRNNIPQQRFDGKIERNLSLAQVLRILEKSQVKFNIEGNTIVVN